MNLGEEEAAPEDDQAVAGDVVVAVVAVARNNQGLPQSTRALAEELQVLCQVTDKLCNSQVCQTKQDQCECAQGVSTQGRQKRGCQKQKDLVQDIYQYSQAEEQGHEGWTLSGLLAAELPRPCCQH